MRKLWNASEKRVKCCGLSFSVGAMVHCRKGLKALNIIAEGICRAVDSLLRRSNALGNITKTKFLPAHGGVRPWILDIPCWILDIEKINFLDLRT